MWTTEKYVISHQSYFATYYVNDDIHFIINLNEILKREGIKKNLKEVIFSNLLNYPTSMTIPSIIPISYGSDATAVSPCDHCSNIFSWPTTTTFTLFFPNPKFTFFNPSIVKWLKSPANSLSWNSNSSSDLTVNQTTPRNYEVINMDIFVGLLSEGITSHGVPHQFSWHIGCLLEF